MVASNTKSNKAPVRLFCKGVHLGYQRSIRNYSPNVSLIKIQDVESDKDAEFYRGKRVAYVYKAKTEKNGSKMRVVWGVLRRPHGCNGVMRASFTRNLPPKSFGARVRVMLYPSSI